LLSIILIYKSNTKDLTYSIVSKPRSLAISKKTSYILFSDGIVSNQSTY